MASKNDKSVDARAAAKAQAQQQVKAQERRTTVIIIAVALLVIATFAGIVYFIVNSSKVPDLPEAHAPATADETGGIPVGTGGVAGADVPTDALRVDVYVDLMCPYCKMFEDTNSDDLDELREAGTIALVYHPISILDRSSQGTKYSTRAANALAVVADKDPSHFLAFLDVLYANQPEELTPGLSDDEIASLAEGVGVPADVAAGFAGGEFTKWVTAATQQASTDGMASTPTIMVDREVLDYKVTNFFEPGVLKAYLEDAAK